MLAVGLSRVGAGGKRYRHVEWNQQLDLSDGGAGVVQGWPRRKLGLARESASQWLPGDDGGRSGEIYFAEHGRDDAVFAVVDDGWGEREWRAVGR